MPWWFIFWFKFWIEVSSAKYCEKSLLELECSKQMLRSPVFVSGPCRMRIFFPTSSCGMWPNRYWRLVSTARIRWGTSEDTRTRLVCASIFTCPQNVLKKLRLREILNDSFSKPKCFKCKVTGYRRWDFWGPENCRGSWKMLCWNERFVFTTFQ